MLVHPRTTTRAKTAEEKNAPSTALRLLRLANMYAGPFATRLDTAFSFNSFASTRHGTRYRDTDDEEDESTGYQYGEKQIDSELASYSSVWSMADDFWHAVGWAFNCSILYPEWWERWRLWLEYMCEVLEDDWHGRLKMGAGGGGYSNSNGVVQEGKEDEGNALNKSLIVQYLTSDSSGYGGIRRILRAVLADGGGMSRNEFREVFDRELKEPSSEKEKYGNTKKRRAEVNIDEDQYGDYLSTGWDDEDSDTRTETRAVEEDTRQLRRSKRSRRSTRNSTGNVDGEVKNTNTITLDVADNMTRLQGGVHLLGGFSSLSLRQRLMHLLSNVAFYLPNEFISIDELYHLFIENVRYFPLPIFQAFVGRSTLPYFSVAAHTTLCEYLLFHMIEDSAHSTTGGNTEIEESLTQEKLETCLLPFAASKTSVIDNAKVSITLESLLILLMENGMLVISSRLRQAVNRGIEARTQKAESENKKNRRVEDVDWCWLLESSERLLFLVDGFE